MTVVALANLEAAANTQPHHTAAAQAFVRVCHADCGLTYGQVEHWTALRAGQHEFQVAVDAGREDVVAELELLRGQIAAEHLRTEQATVALRHAVRRAEELQRRIDGAVEVIDRAGEVGPGHGAAVLGNVRLTLTSSRDDEHTQRREAMLSGRHPEGRALTPTLNDFE